jgi:hypothetical protein
MLHKIPPTTTRSRRDPTRGGREKTARTRVAHLEAGVKILQYSAKGMPWCSAISGTGFACNGPSVRQEAYHVTGDTTEPYTRRAMG